MRPKNGSNADRLKLVLVEVKKWMCALYNVVAWGQSYKMACLVVLRRIRNLATKLWKVQGMLIRILLLELIPNMYFKVLYNKHDKGQSLYDSGNAYN